MTTIHELRVEGVEGAAEWDAALAMFSGASHCHLSGWLRTIRRVFGHRAIALAARDDGGTLAGLLPLVEVRSLLFGHFLVSQPYLNYGGPVGSDTSVRLLTDRAIELAAASKVGLLELRSRKPLQIPLTASLRKVTVVLPLAATPEDQMAAFPAKLRSQVRRPMKDGLTTRFGPEQVGAFFEVFAENMRDLGTPVLPRRFFEVAAEELAPYIRFGVVYLGQLPVAAGCGMLWGGEFEMVWASSLRAHQKSAPNMLLYWSSMERAIAEGAVQFNFGRCSVGSGTHKFKLQWGAHDEQLYWYQRARGATKKTPSADDGAYAWGPRLWRRLPVPIATMLGPMIVRGIP